MLVLVFFGLVCFCLFAFPWIIKVFVNGNLFLNRRITLGKSGSPKKETNFFILLGFFSDNISSSTRPYNNLPSAVQDMF